MPRYSYFLFGWASISRMLLWNSPCSQRSVMSGLEDGSDTVLATIDIDLDLAPLARKPQPRVCHVIPHNASTATRMGNPKGFSRNLGSV